MNINFYKVGVLNYIMGVLDNLKTYFSGEKQKVYCQDCGYELTNSANGLSKIEGGYILNSGSYDERCFYQLQMDRLRSREISPSEFSKALLIQSHNPRQLQKAIRKGKLTRFGKLEEIAKIS